MLAIGAHRFIIVFCFAVIAQAILFHFVSLQLAF